MNANTPEIRALNDKLRQTFSGGQVVMTAGIAALGPDAVRLIAQTIMVFDDFNAENDPHGEHDFGMFEVDGRNIMFKIDYYDETMTFHSRDPADPAATRRVITIMLAKEY